jgi:hypothetical protein
LGGGIEKLLDFPGIDVLAAADNPVLETTVEPS